MTKKDYELIAMSIRATKATFPSQLDNEVGKASVDTLAFNLGAVLAQENPRFDYGRFIEACGIEPERKPFQGTRFEED